MGKLLTDQITLRKKISEGGWADTEPGHWSIFSTHLTIRLMFERGNLLDCHFLLPRGVPGLHHGAVGSLAQELDGLVPGSNLVTESGSKSGHVEKIKSFYG